MARPRGKRLIQERQRKEAEQLERKRAADRRRFAVLGIAAVAVMSLAVGWIFLSPEAPWVVYDSVGNDHITGIGQPHAPYNSSPPSSGPHLGSLVEWREHEQAIPPEAYVHNLEDGGVALTYNCPAGCEAVTDTLRAVLADYEDDNVLMFPFDDIVDPDGVERTAAAVAWGRVYYFDDVSDPRTEEDLRDFINSFEGINNHVGA